MVAYNLMLALFPFALLVLFIFGQVLQSDSAEHSALSDLQQIFPDTEQETLTNALDRVRQNSTEIGIVASIAGLWIGASFWGAMDTAFCRIYHVECRGWVEQKRFSILMLFVVAIFLAASIAIPAIEGLVIAGTDDLPLGLDGIDLIANLILIVGGLTIIFLMLCLIYWAVPKGHLPWRGVWPGALFATILISTANAAFPFYLVNISTIGQFGRTVSFVLIALVWFYLISLILLSGAVTNALRFELHDTGSLSELDSHRDPGEGAEAPAQAQNLI